MTHVLKIPVMHVIMTDWTQLARLCPPPTAPRRRSSRYSTSIAINLTTLKDVDTESSATVFFESKTEMALLKFAKDLGWANYKDIRDAANVVLMIPFSSERKSMGCVVRLPDGVHRLFMKGASEILMRKSMRHVVVHRNGTNNVPSGTGIETAPIGELEEDTSHV